MKVLPPIPTADLSRSATSDVREQVRSRIVEQLAAWRGVPPEEVDAVGRAGRVEQAAE